MDYYVANFKAILGFEVEIDTKLLGEAQKLLKYVEENAGVDLQRAENQLIKSINEKFDFNKEFIQILLKENSKAGISFNFNEKAKIRELVDLNNLSDLKNYFKILGKGILTNFLNIQPYATVQTLTKLHEVYRRSDFKKEIISSLFAVYVSSLGPIKVVHRYFSGREDKTYDHDFYQYLLNNEPELLKRGEGFHFVFIDRLFIESFSDYQDLSQTILGSIKKSYDLLANHSYIGIYLDASINNDLQIRLYGDITLFAEKFMEKHTDIGYFKPRLINEVTSSYVNYVETPDFEKINEGFNYKDAFILTIDKSVQKSNTISFEPYSMLIMLEKNKRDERVVPCPACRSKVVRGNSYPTIGVKSWECKNNLCPERSKYNRGKRYSLSSIIRQEAINDERNLISIETIKKWRLDVVNITGIDDVIDLIVTHYSLFGDSVITFNLKPLPKVIKGRRIVQRKLEPIVGNNDKFLSDGEFFKRFYVKDFSNGNFTRLESIPKVDIINGNCFHVLKSFKSDSFDGAVTSPPYYNAKDYSSWPNIYCFLYDMYNIHIELFRTLKSGGIYLFNIFDYFDNENIVILSDMGKKRIILGAYLLHIFETIGFQILGNIVWFKGEIQGKRNFNQGNFSPYYQAPHNAYEHIFVLGKDISTFPDLPKILRAKPVFKMISGKNVVGHDAPFPETIPNLLLDILGQNAKYILDPFGGTMTTAKAALKRGVASVSIEQDLSCCLREIRNLKANELEVIDISLL